MEVKDKIINRLEELNLKYTCHKGIYEEVFHPYHKINIELDPVANNLISLIIFDGKELDYMCIYVYLENKKIIENSSKLTTLEALQKFNIWQKN